MPRRNSLRVFRWRNPDSLHGNFGDEITIPLLRRIFGIEAVPANFASAELVGAGSILDAAGGQRRLARLRARIPWGRSSDLHVWGTGLMLPQGDSSWPQRVHFHAVRGGLTAQAMGVDVVLADPGILASLLVDRPPTPKFAIGIIPNHVDTQLLAAQDRLPRHWTLVNPEQPVDAVIGQLAACDLIISSSLHGLITADAFGIPCVWARTSRPLFGNSDFKFRDYESSRMSAFNEPRKYDDLFEWRADQIAEVATKARRDVGQWQQELIDAFPFV